jgi:hypothetical protein
MRISRVSQLVSPPMGQHMDRLPDEVAAQWQRVDEDNTQWLGEIVTRRGWRGRTLVDKKGVQAAWLLAQHADHDPGLQRHSWQRRGLPRVCGWFFPMICPLPGRSCRLTAQSGIRICEPL